MKKSCYSDSQIAWQTLKWVYWFNAKRLHIACTKHSPENWGGSVGGEMATLKLSSLAWTNCLT